MCESESEGIYIQLGLTNANIFATIAEASWPRDVMRAEGCDRRNMLIDQYTSGRRWLEWWRGGIGVELHGHKLRVVVLVIDELERRD